MGNALSYLGISSLRGGLNETEVPTAIPQDQCSTATNVEFTDSMLGERRRGTTAVTIAGSDLVGKDRVTFLYRHLPTADETASELWAFGVTGTASSALVRKTTAWSTVTQNDAITLTGGHQYRLRAQTLHGKLFIAFKSAVDRLHVWDGTSLRRTGQATPAAPTGADTGAGTLSTTRYYRVRYTVQSGGVTLRRSEPGAVLTFTPSGSGTHVRVTKPATISEGETHWELEASFDNQNFYRIATTVVGTTTYDDNTPASTGYGAFPLSEDTGDYTNIWSARYLAADNDRLVFAGSFEDDTLSARVGWSPVKNADGVGNDERHELDTDPTLDLDTNEGGPITGLAKPLLGSLWAFKYSHIYKLVRSGERSRAYEAYPYSKAAGALHDSVLEGVDQFGNPCTYFLDPKTGPSRLNTDGLRRCGDDIKKTWKTINLDATATVCSAVWYPDTFQAVWHIATAGANRPNLAIVLHTRHTRNVEDGVRKGWSKWNGTRASALCACLYADNINANAARSLVLKPFIGTEGAGLLHITDTGDDDNGTAYEASIIARAHVLRNILCDFEAKAGALIAKAAAGAKCLVKIVRDFGLSTVSSESQTFDPTATEDYVIKRIDELNMAELKVAQVQFVDTSPAGTRWQLEQFFAKETEGQTS